MRRFGAPVFCLVSCSCRRTVVALSADESWIADVGLNRFRVEEERSLSQDGRASAWT